MRYTYFSFIILFIIMLAFCTSCTDNSTNHRALHGINVIPQSVHDNEKQKIFQEECHLVQQKQKLLDDISHIHFD